MAASWFLEATAIRKKKSAPAARKKGKARAVDRLSPAAEQNIDALVQGLIETEAMEACARYLARGRSLANLSDGEVMERWARGFRDVCKKRTDANMQALDDAGSELQLRGIEPDNSLVADEFRWIAEQMQQLQIEYPQGHPVILNAVADYLQRVNKETN